MSCLLHTQRPIIQHSVLWHLLHSPTLHLHGGATADQGYNHDPALGLMSARPHDVSTRILHVVPTYTTQLPRVDTGLR
jgi:hypothetical protein